MKAVKLNPEFESLDKPSTFTNHINDLTKVNSVPHAEILSQLIDQFEPLDFQTIAFPETVKIKKELEKLTTKFRSDSDNEDLKGQIAFNSKVLSFTRLFLFPLFLFRV